MKQFNLQLAINGKNVVTRTGVKASKFFVSGDKLYGVVHDLSVLSCNCTIEKWNLNGTKYNGVEHHRDLFMAV